MKLRVAEFVRIRGGSPGSTTTAASEFSRIRLLPAEMRNFKGRGRPRKIGPQTVPLREGVGSGVFSLSDLALNWRSPECLILFHSGLLRGAITKSRTSWMTKRPLGLPPCSAAAEPAGFTDISRGLSAAIPPEDSPPIGRTPEGCQGVPPPHASETPSAIRGVRRRQGGIPPGCGNGFRRHSGGRRCA